MRRWLEACAGRLARYSGREMPSFFIFQCSLSYMNNIAFVRGMEPVFTHSCYVATFGEYDLGAVRGNVNGVLGE